MNYIAIFTVNGVKNASIMRARDENDAMEAFKATVANEVPEVKLMQIVGPVQTIMMQ